MSARRASWIRRICWSCWPSLILLSTSCATPPPARPLPPEAVCQQWNREELVGYFVLTQLAIEENARGDSSHIAAAVEATGRMLFRCRILR